MPLNHVGKKRLLKLAEFLEKLPPKRFNLNILAEGPVPPSKELTCGTAGCAMGYCPVVFPRSVKYTEGGPRYDDMKDYGVCLRDNEDLQDFDFAAEFFGLDGDQLGYLFSSYYYPDDRKGPKSVSRRIKYFVEKNGKVDLSNRNAGVR